MKTALSEVRNKKGFTLIELLLVISILALMASLILQAVNPVKKMGQARDAKRKMDLAQLRDALSAYQAMYGSYPIALGWHGDAANFGGYGYEGLTGYIPNLAPDSIKRLPQDPRVHTIGSTLHAACTAGDSGYLYSSDGTDFKLMAHCTPENYPPASENPFYDPIRPTWAYAVWSSDASKGW